MLTAGQEFRNPRTGTAVRILESSPERFRYERTMPPGTGKSDAHVHFDFDQTWTCRDGAVRVVDDGEDRTLRAGESIAFPRGRGHVDAFNAGTRSATVELAIEPQPRFVEVFAATWTHLLERDELNEQDEFTSAQLFAVLDAGKGQSFAVGPPLAVQRLIIPVAGRLARVRGVRPVLG